MRGIHGNKTINGNDFLQRFDSEINRISANGDEVTEAVLEYRPTQHCITACEQGLYLIMDEFQNIKNKGSAQTHAHKNLYRS